MGNANEACGKNTNKLEKNVNKLNTNFCDNNFFIILENKK
jgi:hypothetical protein